MPGYHVYFVIFECRGYTVLYVSVRPGRYAVWRSPAPLCGIDLPLRGFVLERYCDATIEELDAIASSKDVNYYTGRVYNNYPGGLDLHLRQGAMGDLHYYLLTMPETVPSDAIVTADSPWPQPIHWHYAVGKVWQGLVYDPNDDDVYGSLFDVEAMDGITLPPPETVTVAIAADAAIAHDAFNYLL